MGMPAATQGLLATTVVDWKLDELCACLDDALSSRKRSLYTEERLRAMIDAKTDFVRSLLSSVAECNGGALPEHLAEAEARFAVLAATYDRWARRAVAAPEPVVEEKEEEADSLGSSRSTCSCTESCQEATEGDAMRDAVETRGKEGTSDGIAEDNDAECETVVIRREEAAAVPVAKKRDEAMGTREEVALDAIAKKKGDTDRDAAAETGRRTVDQRRWWRRSAAWCGAAGVVALVAVGLAVELVAVADHDVNAYVVPT